MGLVLNAGETMNSAGRRRRKAIYQTLNSREKKTIFNLLCIVTGHNNN